MVITLKEELIRCCALDSDDPKELEFFELMAEIRRRGFHFVVVDRNLLVALLKLKELSDRAKDVYKMMYLSFTTEKAILATITPTISIGSNTVRRNGKKVELCISDISPNDFLSENKLLLENSNDARIYKKIASFFQKKKQLKEVEIKWDVLNGGGATTHSEYDRLTQLEKNYVLCILDSDKLSPNDKLGNTAEKFNTVPINTLYGEYYILPVHEMENLMPEGFINATTHFELSYRQNQKIVDELTNDKNCDALLYADLKKGVSRGKIYKLPVHGQQYWDTILKRHGYRLRNCGCTSKGCKHFYLKPYGNSVLNDLLDIGDKFGLEIETFVSGYYAKLWLEIGDFLNRIFCSPGMMRT